MAELISRPLVEIGRELRERRLTAGEVVEAAIARHERFGKRLHAYSLWTPEKARETAKAADAAFLRCDSRATSGRADLDQRPLRGRRVRVLRRFEPSSTGRSLGAGWANRSHDTEATRCYRWQNPHGRVRVWRNRSQ